MLGFVIHLTNRVLQILRVERLYQIRRRAGGERLIADCIVVQRRNHDDSGRRVLRVTQITQETKAAQSRHAHVAYDDIEFAHMAKSQRVQAIDGTFNEEAQFLQHERNVFDGCFIVINNERARLRIFLGRHRIWPSFELFSAVYPIHSQAFVPQTASMIALLVAGLIR